MLDLLAITLTVAVGFSHAMDAACRAVENELSCRLSPAWVAQLQDARNAQSVKETLLLADLRLALSATSQALPTNIHDVEDGILSHSVMVQVVEATEIGRSTLSIINDLELENTRPARQVEAVAFEPENNVTPAADANTRMCKLVVEDCKGTRAFGLETKSIPGVSPIMPLGTKFLLHQGTQITLGVLLLRPAQITTLGYATGNRNQEHYLAQLKAKLGIQV